MSTKFSSFLVDAIAAPCYRLSMKNDSVTRIAVALAPEEIVLLEKIRRKMAARLGVWQPTTQIVRMGLRALAKQEGLK